ncbi:MAG: hypothetical protein WAN91_03880, partial [Saccharofermentanales bacterium]
LFTMFSMPSAMCLYWLFQNIMYLIQSLLGYKFYVTPLRLAYAEEQATFDRSRRKDSSSSDEDEEEGGFFKKLVSKLKDRDNQG